jgi:GNAT superfamily N-acetyltransferase
VRLLKADNPGYGYVDDATPELAIGVHRDYRGSGVGTAMLARLIGMAKEHYTALSLSTRAAPYVSMNEWASKRSPAVT